tara:strand:- start:149 stop:445 length:297 start_codon:yes stop_codon:yes gene_type:complete
MWQGNPEAGLASRKRSLPTLEAMSSTASGIPSPQCLVAHSDSPVFDQSLSFNPSLRSMARCLTTLHHRYVTERFLGVMITDVFTAGISFQEVSSLGIM